MNFQRRYLLIKMQPLAAVSRASLIKEISKQFQLTCCDRYIRERDFFSHAL